MKRMSSGFHPQAFTRANNEPDAVFYAKTQHVPSIDLGARAAVTALYQTTLPASGTILDLMAGTESHLPPEATHEHVIGLDINPKSLAANSALTERLVQDLNSLFVTDLQQNTLDAVCVCDGVAYLTHPLDVFEDVHRVLRPGAPFIITFSDHFHPQKAVALWQALDGPDRVRFVTHMLEKTGFVDLDTGEVVPPEDLTAWEDTVYAVIGRKPPHA